MAKVSAEYKSYNENEWAKANKSFERLNNKWYERFKDELSLKEKLLISGYKIKFSSLKAVSKFDNRLQSVIKDDIDSITDKIDSYIEGKIDADLDQMLQDIKDLSKKYFD